MRRSLRADVTIAELTRYGLEAVAASCLGCGAEWQTPIKFLPPATSLAKVAALMVCPTCGGRDVEIQEPIWLAGRWVH
jgi:Zn finger protein HypA/HybF involved in hydrogenase expression